MLTHWDERRDVIALGDEKTTVFFAATYIVALAALSIAKKGRFAIALSGGSTPKAIFEKLTSKPDMLDWTRVYLFWSDERSVPPDHPDSNYRMAMEAGFKDLPIPPNQIFRMQAENHIEEHALEYEEKIREILGPDLFDLVLLGVGEDGHTASLFPGTSGLESAGRLAVANYVPEKKTWRMTLTFEAINQSQQAIVLSLGKAKASIVKEVLKAQLPSPYPASFVGTKKHKALWITDLSQL